MTSVRQKAKLLRDECESLARVAERKMLSPSLSVEERDTARDQAKVYWQLSRHHADTLYYAELARPTSFSGKQPRGKSVKTVKRGEFVTSAKRDYPLLSHKELALEIYERDEAKQLWPNSTHDGRFGSIYQFIRRQPKP